MGEASSLLKPHGSQGSNSCCQASWKVPLPAEFIFAWLPSVQTQNLVQRPGERGICSIISNTCRAKQWSLASEPGGSCLCWFCCLLSEYPQSRFLFFLDCFLLQSERGNTPPTKCFATWVHKISYLP